MTNETIPSLKEFSCTCCLLSPVHAQSVSSCTWPMRGTVVAPDSKDYPEFTPFALKDYPATVTFVFTKQNNNSEFIEIKEVTTIGLNKLVRDYPSFVENSDGWRDLQSRLNCNDRAGDYSYEMNVVDGYLIAGFSTNVEKYWCASADVPCPVFPADPLRMCRQESNGKLWGARVSSASKIELQQDGQGAFNLVVIETTTSSNTSNEQNFVRDLLGSVFLGPIGVDVIQDVELSAFKTIKDSMRAGFNGRSFQLVDGTALPKFPNYNPKIVRLRIAEHSLLGVTANIEREVPEYRERTGCFLAKSLGARTFLTDQSTPTGRCRSRRGC
jgi:hypothetical protein